jgi:hypothetical protein
MGDPARSRDPDEDAGAGADRGSPPGMPRWVKVAGIIVAVVVLLLLVLLIAGGGHRPRPHASGDAGGHAPLAGGTASLTLSGVALEDSTRPGARRR